MKYLVALLFVAFSLPSLHAGGTLKDARQRLLRGNYAEAQEQYAELMKDAKLRPAATIGVSQAMEMVGNYDEALAAIDKALKDLPEDADLLARRGELLYLRGRWDDAEKSARKALDKNDEHFLARWVVGQVLRDKGELDKAYDEDFRWFVRIYTKRSNDDMEITDPETLRIIGLAASERARWHHLTQQFQFIIDEVYGATAKKDKDFWWADYEAGQLFLEKFNKQAAERALDRALVINPRAAPVLASKGLSAAQRFEFKEADQYADQALRINPKLTSALRLKADIYLFAGDQAQAMKVLDKARAVNPRDEMTLARVAACLYGQRQKAELEALMKEVEEHNPKASIFYSEFAELLEGRKSYDDAEKYYQKAMEQQPKLPAAQNGLGMLYVRLGKEEKGKELLEEGTKADRFNVRVVNTLKVLDHLEKYDTLKTEHFIIRFDPKHDKVLANFMAKYLEDIYGEYATKFNYRPKGPFLIEVFNRHEMFSGRIMALPDLHTIGACTGRIMAMVSPRDLSKRFPEYNWVRVVRHELVHVFNLDQTRFQVPHWLTEGLAVSEEGTGIPPEWRNLLPDAKRYGELLNLDNILLAFVRPRTPNERALAYYQSLLYVQYVTRTHGDKAIGALLAAFAEGLDSGAAVEKACGVKKADFEKGYRDFLEERIKEGRQTARRAMTFKQLKAAHADNPDDAGIAAELAEQYLNQGKKKLARELADKALKAGGKQPLAATIKARLLIDEKDQQLAVTLLESNIDGDTKETRALKMMAEIQRLLKKPADAAKTLEQGRKVDPDDPDFVEDLVPIYVKSGEEAKLADVLKDLARLRPDNLQARRRLAQYFLKDGKLADAEKYARQALEIDVLDTVAQDVLIDALTRQNKDDDLRLFKKLLER